ncbi:MAG: hypothetical protein JXQ67_07300 [Campylobacterales bacterium]|nr:hypothetical protein [Campylobacterales bacterium]
MKYPDFFRTIETIKLQDELSSFLGTFEDGFIEFSYLDVVKSAGHSCPTVAGAYIMTLVGLQELYSDELPKRGDVILSFQEGLEEANTGVFANVMSHITGAAYTMGFKGINGKFQRSGLIQFKEQISSSVKLERIDTKKSVELTYDASCIQIDVRIPELMKKVLTSTATKEEKTLFGELWQQRVQAIFQNIDKVIVRDDRREVSK